MPQVLLQLGFDDDAALAAHTAPLTGVKPKGRPATRCKSSVCPICRREFAARAPVPRAHSRWHSPATDEACPVPGCTVRFAPRSNGASKCKKTHVGSVHGPATCGVPGTTWHVILDVCDARFRHQDEGTRCDGDGGPSATHDPPDVTTLRRALRAPQAPPVGDEQLLDNLVFAEAVAGIRGGLPGLSPPRFL